MIKEDQKARSIIFFTHPAYLHIRSLGRFTDMIDRYMGAKGYGTEQWSPAPLFYNLPLVPQGLRKWLGYIDQFVIFPIQVRRRLKKCDSNALFVFTDQALGPWVPLVADRRHVIHCHDFIAQQSAQQQIAENPTKKFGRIYQSYIRKGYSKGKTFISVSNKTQQDLHLMLPAIPEKSAVVYNGLGKEFGARDRRKAAEMVGDAISRNVDNGYFLHVGGNNWYKNRKGVIEIYDAWRNLHSGAMPLILVGEKPDQATLNAAESSEYKNDIFFLSDRTNEFVCNAYSAATAFLFPSYAEGFGWPIAEAMACGCPVITTGEAPMTEVGGHAAIYIPKKPAGEVWGKSWAKDAAKVLAGIVSLSESERAELVNNGFLNVRKFDQAQTLSQIEAIYRNVALQDL